ncbi:hypothetical protein D3C79_771530 [compost metagenome]
MDVHTQRVALAVGQGPQKRGEDAISVGQDLPGLIDGLVAQRAAYDLLGHAALCSAGMLQAAVFPKLQANFAGPATQAGKVAENEAVAVGIAGRVLKARKCAVDTRLAQVQPGAFAQAQRQSAGAAQVREIA